MLVTRFSHGWRSGVGEVVGRISECLNVLSFEVLRGPEALTEDLMRRRDFILLSGAAAAWPCVARALNAGQMRRIAVLFVSPAASFNIGLVRADMSSDAEIGRAIATFAREPNGGLIVLPGAITGTNREFITAVATAHRLPGIYGYRYFVASDDLISYEIDSINAHRRAAMYVDSVRRGAKLGDLLIQQSTKFELVINLKAARAIGLEVPSTLLARADEVIE